MSQAFFPIIQLHIYLPDTEWSSARRCSIPLFPDMTTDDANHVVDAIENVMDRAQ